MRISSMKLSGAAALAGAALFTLAACGQEGGDAADTAAPAQPQAAAAACDRQCLLDKTDAYVAALAAKDPSRAPLAASIAFVENAERKQPGEGLWQSIVSGPTQFAIPVPDPVTQQVGYLAMMTRMAAEPAPQGATPEERAAHEASAPQSEQPVLVAFRLKFEDGEIVEAEHLLTGVREAQLANLQALRPGILSEIPADRRLPHEELIRIGYSYYDALDDNDGSLAPFADNCQRHENGMITASPDDRAATPAIPGTEPTPNVARDCRRQLDSGSFIYIDRIENRRVFAADPVTGLVIGLSHFRHPMDNLPYQVTNLDGTTMERNSENLNFAPFDLPAAHIYKVGPDGLIHEIEAMGFTTIFNAPTGWE